MHVLSRQLAPPCIQGQHLSGSHGTQQGLELKAGGSARQSKAGGSKGKCGEVRESGAAESRDGQCGQDGLELGSAGQDRAVRGSAELWGKARG